MAMPYYIYCSAGETLYIIYTITILYIYIIYYILYTILYILYIIYTAVQGKPSTRASC